MKNLMKARIHLWKHSRSLALLLLLGLALVAAGCPGNSNVGQLGSACQSNDDCTAELECRAKICRTKIPNTKPVAVLRVDPDKGAKVGDKILLIGENSRDEELDALTYTWNLDIPDGSSVNLDNPKAARTSFIPDVAGEYTVKLVVNDGKIDSDEVSLKVVVEDADNTAPIANAGPDQEVLPASKVTLDGTSSSDAEGDKLTYAWTIKSKPDGSNAAFDKSDVDKPTFTADLPGDYIIALVVTDIRGAKSQEDTVTVRSIKDLDKVPSIDSITPNEAIAQSIIDVVLKGKNFADGATLLIGSKSVNTTFTSDTELKVKLDLNGVTPGENDIKVINPNRKESNVVKFNVKPIPVPELTKLDPALAPVDAKIIVTITGKNFIQKSEVLFETTPLKTTYSSETELKAEVDLSGLAEGEYQISVANPGGISSKTSLPFKIIKKGPPPVLNVLNPPQGKTGEKVTFSVHGTGFEVGAVIVFDGKDIPTKRIRRDELQADPSLDLTQIATGEYDVWVRNIDGQITAKLKFRVEGLNPTPVLDRVLPFIIYIGEKSTLSVFGNGFSKQAKFFINGKSIPLNPSRISSTFLEANFDGTTGNWTPGNYKAHIENPGASNPIKSNDFNVTVTHPTPNIDTVTPGGWNPGCDVDVTITGKNFVNSSYVNFGSIKFEQNATNPKFKLTRNGSTELKFKIAKSDLSVTTYNVNVTNGPNAKSSDYKFPVITASNTPVIDSLQPAAGAADSVVSVLVNDNYSAGKFLPGSYVEINGKQMPTACDLASTNAYCYDLTAQIDLSGIKPGNLDLYVVNPCQKKSAAATFVVTEAPQPYLSAIEPAFGTVGQKSLMVFRGEDLAKGHKLYINNKLVPSTWVGDTEIRSDAAVDLTGITAGTDIDIYILHDNGKKTPVVKYSVLAAAHTPTITKLSAKKFEIAKSHSNVEIDGSGFTTNSEVFMDGTKLNVSFNGPSKLTIGSLNLTNVTAGIKLLQVKDGTKTSNYYPLFAAPPPAPVVRYLSPASRIKGQYTSTYLYVYGNQFCPGVTSRCPSIPTVTIKGPDGKDYSTKYSKSYSYDTYVYGTFTLTGLPAGAYIFTVQVPGSVKSNPGVFNHTPPPPPSITSVNSAYRGDSRNIDVQGSNLSSDDILVIDGKPSLNKAKTGSTATVLKFDYDMSKIKYAGDVDLQIWRCKTPQCTSPVKSNTIKLTVLELPNCTLVDCATQALPAGSEICGAWTPPGSSTSTPTCRPKCTTDTDCKNMGGAPSTAKCHATGKYCAYK